MFIVSTWILSFTGSFAIYRYTNPDFLYMQSWVPCLYFSGGVTIGAFGRALAKVSRDHFSYSKIIVLLQSIFLMYNLCYVNGLTLWNLYAIYIVLILNGNKILLKLPVCDVLQFENREVRHYHMDQRQLADSCSSPLHTVVFHPQCLLKKYKNGIDCFKFAFFLHLICLDNTAQ